LIIKYNDVEEEEYVFRVHRENGSLAERPFE